MKNIDCGQLQKVDAEILPAGLLVGEEGQLVVLVHGDHPADILLADHLYALVILYFYLFYVYTFYWHYYFFFFFFFFAAAIDIMKIPL